MRERVDVCPNGGLQEKSAPGPRSCAKKIRYAFGILRAPTWTKAVLRAPPRTKKGVLRTRQFTKNCPPAFREGDSRIRQGRAQRDLAILRRLTLNLLHREKASPSALLPSVIEPVGELTVSPIASPDKMRMLWAALVVAPAVASGYTKNAGPLELPTSPGQICCHLAIPQWRR